MRAILHLDMDAFFTSVEQLDRPALRGRPVMVGGRSGRGVVAAASYEARQFGVRSAMPAARARKLCPQGVFLPARFDRYRAVSGQVFGIFHEYSDQVEGLSLDEAYLDFSAQVEDQAELLALGRRLKHDIATRVGLTASVGMGENKLLAKLASDYDKPDGLVLIAPDRVQAFLDPLPVRRLPGVGQRSAQRLNEVGILTIGQLRKTAPDVLAALFGKHHAELLARARGIDSRPVQTGRVRRSISQENTLASDLHSLSELKPLIKRQAERVAEGLRRRGLYARTVTLKLRSTGFSTITRRESLPGYTRSAGRIEATAWVLLESWSDWRSGFSIRLVGVGVSGLETNPELELLLD